MRQRLEASVWQAHHAVGRIANRCAGGMATMVAVAWRHADDQATFVSIGDSRLYRLMPDDLVQVSRDDKQAVPVRRDGKPALSGGLPVVAFGLTRALGQSEPLDFRAAECEFRAGESLVLATDGAHGEGLFAGEIAELLARPAPADKIEPLAAALSDRFADDATLAILRRSDHVPDAMQRFARALAVQQSFRQCGLAAHTGAELLIHELNRVLDDADGAAGSDEAGDRATELIAYAERQRTPLPRALLIEWFAAASRKRTPGAARLVTALRRLVLASDV